MPAEDDAQSIRSWFSRQDSRRHIAENRRMASFARCGRAWHATKRLDDWNEEGCRLAHSVYTRSPKIISFFLSGRSKSGKGFLIENPDK
jgi:hypothetical protein